MIDSAPLPISVLQWELWNGHLPRQRDRGLPGTAAFDTTAALIKSGAQHRASYGRSTVTTCPAIRSRSDATGDSTEVQLKFRIPAGTGQLQDPGECAAAQARAFGHDPHQPADDSFWTEYILNPGKGKDAFPTTGPCKAADRCVTTQRWDELTWCNARMDTADAEPVPDRARNINFPVQVGTYATMYHESDPHLGRSVFAAQVLPGRHAAAANSTNITCTTVPAWVTAGGVPNRKGYDGNPITVEGTKIIPDGC
jgi:hypothetical protein